MRAAASKWISGKHFTTSLMYSKPERPAFVRCVIARVAHLQSIFCPYLQLHLHICFADTLLQAIDATAKARNGVY